MFKTLKERYILCGTDKVYLFSTTLAVLALSVSSFINYYAGTYATEQASNSVTDIILSNTRAYDVDGIFVYGSFLLIAFIVALLIIHPKRVPFTLYSVTLFVLIRSLFVSLTHLGPFPYQSALNLGSVASKFIFGGDLFFSGHTGIPFLMALVFWRERFLRYLFIATSLFFGATVLLGHFHYSIDVLSAFFVTYGIFTMAEFFFKKERALFYRE